VKEVNFVRISDFHKNEFIKTLSIDPNVPNTNSTSKSIFICTFFCSFLYLCCF